MQMMMSVVVADKNDYKNKKNIFILYNKIGR